MKTLKGHHKVLQIKAID